MTPLAGNGGRNGASRVAAIDGLRGVLALAVVAWHLGGPLGATWLLIPSDIAVATFFVLSGYVLTRDGRLPRPLPFSQPLSRIGRSAMARAHILQPVSLALARARIGRARFRTMGRRRDPASGFRGGVADMGGGRTAERLGVATSWPHRREGRRPFFPIGSARWRRAGAARRIRRSDLISRRGK
jgi:hypothetical protein